MRGAWRMWRADESMCGVVCGRFGPLPGGRRPPPHATPRQFDRSLPRNRWPLPQRVSSKRSA